jgi:hypothetical protein
VAIDVDDVPSERSKLVAERFNVVGLRDPRALLKRVAVDNKREVG